MKSSVTYAVLGLFVLACLAYFYLVPEERIDPAKMIPRQAMKIMPADENSPIELIQIQNADRKETITLRKKETGWEIFHPLVYPADNMIMEGLITALKLSSRARRLMPEKGWEEYGLQKPAIKVGIETKSSGKRRYLDFGDDSPVGPYVFARWEGDKEYFLVSKDLKNSFSKSLYSLRQKQVFRTPLQDIQKMRLRTTSREFEVEKRVDGWYWLEPIPLLGKQLPKNRVDELVSQFSGLYVKEFLDQETRAQRELGFTLLSPWIRVWGQDAAAKPEEIKVGQEIAARDAYVVHRSDDKSYFLIARSNVRALFQMFETMAGEMMGPEPQPAPLVPRLEVPSVGSAAAAKPAAAPAEEKKAAAPAAA